MSITAEQIVKLFEKDERARKRLAELMVTEPDVRLAIINAVLRDVATKRDLEELGRELKRDIEGVRNEFKADIEKVRRELKTEIEGVKRELKADIEELRKELKGDVEKVRRELKGDIEEVKNELKVDIEGVKREMPKLEGKVNDLTNSVVKVESQLSLLIKVVFAVNLSILLGIIGLLVKGLAP